MVTKNKNAYTIIFFAYPFFPKAYTKNIFAITKIKNVTTIKFFAITFFPKAYTKKNFAITKNKNVTTIKIFVTAFFPKAYTKIIFVVTKNKNVTAIKIFVNPFSLPFSLDFAPWLTSFEKLRANLDQFFVSTFLPCTYLRYGKTTHIIGIYTQRKKIWWQRWSANLLLKTPLVGDILQKIHLARFANTMRLLISTNTPLLTAINLVGQMATFYPVKDSLQQIENMIMHGESLHESLKRFEFYPAKIVQLIKVGEEINRLDFFFEKISNQLSEEVEYKTSTLSNALEPLLIIFLGLVVGIILIAMYLPMFQMGNHFG